MGAVMFSHFNPETIVLLTGVQKDVLRELVPCNASPMLRALAEVAIARSILEAAADGERDPERLRKKAIAEAAFT